MARDHPGAPVKLFLCGDVMTGRGVDQILRHPSQPDLHEPFVRDAREYVLLAEARSGPVPRRADDRYVWGDALAAWEQAAPDVRIANLETSITRGDAFDAGKDIHYRMHPGNVSCLTAAGLDVCVLANNHVLDYGREGLLETLETLERAGIATVGAGRDLAGAQRPAVHAIGHGGRVVVGACAHENSGVPEWWSARPGRPGVFWLPDLTEETAAALAADVTADRTTGDVTVLSIHWGSNWGYAVPRDHVAFAHRLVDEGIDVVYGHSSHHVRPIEIYRGKLILYGCGDFLNDYEGIEGYERYRGDLALTFFPSLDPASGRLVTLRLTPLQMRRLRLQRASEGDAHWLRETLTRISAPFGVRADMTPDGALEVS